MFQIARQFTILALYVIGSHLCKAETNFCALTLEVSGIHGEVIRGVTAALKNETGNIVQQQLVEGRFVQFCDFGFGRHSLVLQNGCSMEIHDVYIKFGIEQKLKAIVNPCRGPSGGDVLGNACFTFVRIASDNGEPIPGARLASSKQQRTADSYGRARVVVAEGDEQAFTVSKNGFETVSFKSGCPRVDLGKDQIVVRMPARQR